MTTYFVAFATVRAHNLHGFFDESRGEVDVAQGMLRYVGDLPPGSLAPDPELDVWSDASAMESRITRLAFQKITWTFERTEMAYEVCSFPGYREGGRCFSGLYPENGLHWDEAWGRDNAFAATNQHPMESTLAVSGAPVSMSSPTRLPIDRPARMGLVALSPRYVDGSGQRYGWTETGALPSSFFGPWNTSDQHYFAPIVHAEGMESLRCDPYYPYCGHVMTRGFSTLVFVAGFRVGLRMPEIHGMLRGLPHVAVPVVVDPRCSAPKVHEVSL